MAETISLDGLFQRCVEHATEIARELNGVIAVEVKNCITSINDIRFRLRIWGSDIGAGPTHQITFSDLFSTVDGALSATLKDTLKGFRDNFGKIDRVLGDLGANYKSAGVGPKERPDDLLFELRTAVTALFELVMILVELSGPIRMEHSRHYKDLRKLVEQKKVSFQEQISKMQKSELRTTSPTPEKEEERHFSDSAVLREIERQPRTSNLTSKVNEVRQSPASVSGDQRELITALDEHTDPWKKTHLLSLDGGGVRTLSTLLILEALMRAVEKQEITYDSTAVSSYSPCIDPAVSQGVPSNRQSAYLPCHYFDYVAGTSTGGLIAIMLGRLRMSVQDCIDEYTTLAIELFAHRSLISVGSFLGSARRKNHSRVLEDRIKRLARERAGLLTEKTKNDGETLYGSEPHLPKTMVLSFAENLNLYMFRSYHYETSIHSPSVEGGLARNLGAANNIPIWQVARATAADPRYFSPIQIGQDRFIDSGFGVNNPTMKAVMEINQLNKLSDKSAALVISIGSGIVDKPPFSRRSSISRFLPSIDFYKLWSGDSERIHRSVSHHTQELGFRYTRLNVQSGLDGIKFDEIRKQAQILESTRAYLAQTEVKNKLTELAKMLVENRQKRSRASIGLWEQFCCGK